MIEFKKKIKLNKINEAVDFFIDNFGKIDFNIIDVEQLITEVFKMFIKSFGYKKEAICEKIRFIFLDFNDLEKIENLILLVEEVEPKILLLIIFSKYLSNIGNYEKAIIILEFSENLVLETKEKKELSVIYYNQAKIHCFLMNYQTSLKYTKKLEPIIEKNSFIMKLINSLQGDLYLKLQNYEKAIENYSEGFRISEEMNYDCGKIECLIGLISANQKVNSKEIKKYFNLLKKLRVKNESKNIEFNLLHCFGRYELNKENFSEAREYFLQSYELSMVLKNDYLAAISTYYLVYINRLLKFEEDALNWQEKFELIFNNLDIILRSSIKFNLESYNIPFSPIFEKKLIVKSFDKENFFINKIENKIFQENSKYEIIINLFNNTIIIDNTIICLDKKPVTRNIINLFVRNINTPINHSILFKKIWKRSYDQIKDSASLRKSISRLRKLLDKKNIHRFILSTDYNEYKFNDKTNYCIILQID
jgi:DNA-binding winged helix-turn-helix (wHTH) protein